VPEPDISLRFLIPNSDSRSEGFESSSEQVDAKPQPQPPSMTRLKEFLKRNNRLSGANESLGETLAAFAQPLLARVSPSDTLSITSKAKLQNTRRPIATAAGTGGGTPCAADGHWRLLA
jgi:hypothetical protein